MGGSMAGLLATRVLADFFERVTLLDRDAPPDTPETRKGVPQGRHAHALLARGEQILSGLFPGLTADLVAGGGFCADMGADMRWFQFGGYKKQHTWGRKTYTQSRPYLEWHVRRRVLALPNVQFRPGAAVAGLTHRDGRVTGVELEQKGPVEADLVVDCTGRGSASQRWLPAMGFEPPPESTVVVDVGYASRFYRRVPGREPTQVLFVYPQPPGERRASALMPVEGERWICTLAGWLGDYPPTDPAAFLEFARTLPAPDIYNVISRTEPLSDPIPHRFPANLRRHYERLARFPQGYLVLGDAICSFNPVYGQGMTSAALQADALSRCLDRGIDATLAHRYFRAVARIVDIPWKLAAGEDFRYPEVRGARPAGTNLVNRYVAMVHRAVTRDARVYGDFLRVLNLLDPPTLLFRPATFWRVLQANLAG